MAAERIVRRRYGVFGAKDRIGLHGAGVDRGLGEAVARPACRAGNQGLENTGARVTTIWLRYCLTTRPPILPRRGGKEVTSPVTFRTILRGTSAFSASVTQSTRNE